jgi:hypothetical protein
MFMFFVFHHVICENGWNEKMSAAGGKGKTNCNNALFLLSGDYPPPVASQSVGGGWRQ